MTVTRLGGRLPRSIRVLLLANGLAYVIELVLIYWLMSPPHGENLILNHFALSTDGLLSGELWQLLTYQFLHDFESPMHLMFNMLMLWMFGTPLAGRWGDLRFLFVYLACGVGGGLLSALSGLVLPDLFGGPAIGASAAVLGLMVAFGMTYPDQKLYLWFMIPLRAKWLAPVSVAIDLMMFISDQSIAVTAHWGGMLTGFLLVSGYWRPGSWPGGRKRRPPTIDGVPLRILGPPTRDDEERPWRGRPPLQRDGACAAARP